MTAGDAPSEVTVVYKEGAGYRLVPVTGAYGGPTTGGELFRMELYVEALEVPESVRFSVVDGALTGELDRQPKERRLVRQLQVGVVMPIASAQLLAEWIQLKLKERDQITAARAAEDPRRSKVPTQTILEYELVASSTTSPTAVSAISAPEQGTRLVSSGSMVLESVLRAVTARSIDVFVSSPFADSSVESLLESVRRASSLVSSIDVVIGTSSSDSSVESLLEFVRGASSSVIFYSGHGSAPTRPVRAIEHTPGVCGGAARIADTRIPVWVLERFRQLGTSVEDLEQFYPSLTHAGIDRALAYARQHPR